MARLIRILITIGTLLVLTSQVGAGEIGNPYKASADYVNSKRHKASDGLTPGQVNAAVSPTTALRSNAESNAYKIGSMDVLDISVFQVPELTKTVQVADTGTVNLPLVGEIPVAGKTAQEVEHDLASRLGDKYLQNPQVTVYVKDYNSQRVTINGAVKVPGVYPMKGKTSLLQCIALAQGMDPTSDSTVLVLRQTGGKRSAAKFDIDAIEAGQARDPTIQGGDVIVAGTSAIKATFNNVLKVLPLVGLFTLL